ncbi:MerR family transcriptional regulator [Pseudomonas asplenii]|uniref:MerR family transcriptional regulator n=1 Tax=Pseudomonas asplenii TaxID=53407 RepID=UPI0037C5934C
MLRYYEEMGVLQPCRTPSGYREYSAREERAVLTIRQLASAGLRLESLRVVLPCVVDDAPKFHPCSAVRASLRKELDRIDGQLNDLAYSRRLLAEMVEQVEDVG